MESGIRLAIRLEKSVPSEACSGWFVDASTAHGTQTRDYWGCWQK